MGRGVGRPPGPRQQQDYPLLKAQFEAEYVPLGRTLTEFCKDRNPPMAIATVSAAFTRLDKKTTLQTFHERNQPIILVAQRRVMEGLAITDPTPAQVRKAEFALKVFEKVSEREEPNPLLTLNQNMVLPPLFPASSLAGEAIRALTEGASLRPPLIKPRIIEAKRKK